jgi:uncharacterized membrane protein
MKIIKSLTILKKNKTKKKLKSQCHNHGVHKKFLFFVSAYQQTLSHEGKEHFKK